MDKTKYMFLGNSGSQRPFIEASFYGIEVYGKVVEQVSELMI